MEGWNTIANTPEKGEVIVNKSQLNDNNGNYQNLPKKHRRTEQGSPSNLNVLHLTLAKTLLLKQHTISNNGKDGANTKTILLFTTQLNPYPPYQPCA
jgi:hypothetical protein